MNLGKIFSAALLALAPGVASAEQTTFDPDQSSISQVNALYALLNADLKKLSPATIEEHLGISTSTRAVVNPKGETEIYFEYFSHTPPRFSLTFSAGYLTLEFNTPTAANQAAPHSETSNPGCIVASDLFSHLNSRWQVTAENSVLGYLSRNFESGKKRLFVEYYKTNECLTQIMYSIKS